MAPFVWLFVLLALSVPAASWKENEPGKHEKVNFEWIVRENEREYGQLNSDECSERWGLKFWEKLKGSRTRTCHGITRFENGPFSVLLMENVSLTSTESTVDYWMTPFLDSEVTVHADCPSFTPSRLFKPFMKQVQHVSSAELEKKCSKWIEEPVYIIPWFDSTNLWHFTELAILPSYFYYGVVQADMMENSRHVQLATLRWPAKRKYNTRHEGFYPTWVAFPEIIEKMIGPMRIVPLEPFKSPRLFGYGECYRKVAWGSLSETHMDIKRLNLGRECFSSILRSSSDLLRSVLSIPVVRNPAAPHRPLRIVFVKRKSTESWTPHQTRRIMSNQEEFLNFLTQKSRTHRFEFEPLEFYYTDMQNAQEQMMAVGRADVLIGVHGAGLAAMIALPPGSVVVELRVTHADSHFNHMAAALGLHYVGVFPSITPISASSMEDVWSQMHAAAKRAFNI